MIDARALLVIAFILGGCSENGPLRVHQEITIEEGEVGETPPTLAPPGSLAAYCTPR